MYGMSTLGPEEMEELDIADRALAASMVKVGHLSMLPVNLLILSEPKWVDVCDSRWSL